MLRFKDFLGEAVLKLRGFSEDNRKKQHAFLDDLDKTSQAHPFARNERIVGSATVHVSPNSEGGIHLHDIRTLEPKSGAGTHALKHLTSLADKHGVHIEGSAKAYSNDKSHITKSSKLKGWYEKHGFNSSRGNEHDGYKIRYEPKKD